MLQPRKNKREYWRMVFRKVMARYDEFVATNGTMSCSQFYKNIEGGGGGSGFNLRVVRVTPTDYICDVELAARRALTPPEHRFFKLVYLTKDEEITKLADSEDKKINQQKKAVQERVGLAFITAKLYPTARYFKPKDLR
jgi:hypothetical protein